MPTDGERQNDTEITGHVAERAEKKRRRLRGKGPPVRNSTTMQSAGSAGASVAACGERSDSKRDDMRRVRECGEMVVMREGDRETLRSDDHLNYTIGDECTLANLLQDAAN